MRRAILPLVLLAPASAASGHDLRPQARDPHMEVALRVLSHASPGTMSDVLNVTQAPVIFSHSSARALTDHVSPNLIHGLPEPKPWNPDDP
jgi:hypothetical protein